MELYLCRSACYFECLLLGLTIKRILFMKKNVKMGIFTTVKIFFLLLKIKVQFFTPESGSATQINADPDPQL